MTLLDRQRALHSGDVVAGESAQEGVGARGRSSERSRAGRATVEQLHARNDVRVGRDVAGRLASGCAGVVDLLGYIVAALDKHPVMLLGRRAVLECDLRLLA